MGTPQDRRRHDRFSVDPMYSAVEVTPARSPRGSAPAEPAEGHIYEVSLGGMRFELDEPLPAGSRVSVAITLPGCPEPIRVEARVARVYDEIDDPGPRRMVAEFETFADGARALLERYLGQKWLRRAPAQVPADDEVEVETCEVMIETNDAGSKGSKSRKSASAA